RGPATAGSAGPQAPLARTARRRPRTAPTDTRPLARAALHHLSAFAGQLESYPPTGFKGFRLRGRGPPRRTSPKLDSIHIRAQAGNVPDTSLDSRQIGHRRVESWCVST